MPIHGYPGNVITANPTAPTVSSASGVWTTEQQLLAVSQGNWPGYEYPLERSLRFNSADSAYLSRTPASAGNRKTFTISYWIKRSSINLGSAQYLFAAGSGTTESTWFNISFDTNGSSFDPITVGTWTTVGGVTTALFRDPSAWYHIVIAIDTTQATASNRCKIYVNGVQQAQSTTTITQNADLAWNNSGVVHYIGARVDSGPRMFFNGYLTEIYNIDGQALTPSSFGLNDPETGVWSAKRYTGTYGTNGFYLNFSDNSGTTSTTLGKDSSGNGNNWTPNNFSVTAGAGNDSLVDSPTSYGTDTGVGGEVRGNYATWNPLAKGADVTLANGNLDFSCTSSGLGGAIGTIAVSSGKWYWEVTPTGGTAGSAIGVAKLPLSAYGANQTGTYLYINGGDKRLSPSTDSAYGASYTNNDVIGVALDMDAGTVVFYKNGVSQGTAFSSLSGDFTAWIQDGSSGNASTFVTNFGQRPFAYTAPSGFKALCTQNLPTPTIGATSTTQANDYMNVVLYTGNGASTGDTQVISSVGFQPDLVWFKSRSNTYSNVLIDSVRGGNSILYSDMTSANLTITGGITTFSSSGFTVAADLTNANSLNTSGSSNVAWNWNAGGSNATNTAGTITSTVRANTTSGFSIISYTGNKTSGATIGHGLGVAPAMVIFKERANASEWIIYHQSLGATQSIYFSTAAANTNSIWFNNTAPSSTVITVGNADGTNRANTMIAYAFAPVAGYSAFGSYTGNGSTDGPFVYTGFRPEFVMIKGSSVITNWTIVDAARNTYNVATLNLRPNSSAAEATDIDFDLLSNGFKMRGSGSGGNNSGSTYIYMAFAESPFKYSLAR